MNPRALESELIRYIRYYWQSPTVNAYNFHSTDTIMDTLSAMQMPHIAMAPTWLPLGSHLDPYIKSTRPDSTRSRTKSYRRMKASPWRMVTGSAVGLCSTTAT